MVSYNRDHNPFSAFKQSDYYFLALSLLLLSSLITLTIKNHDWVKTTNSVKNTRVPFLGIEMNQDLKFFWAFLNPSLQNLQSKVKEKYQTYQISLKKSLPWTVEAPEC